MILWHFLWTQVIAFDPTDHSFSNQSICWLRLGQAEHALSDPKLCRELKPYWPKGCFREGAALCLLQVKNISILLHWNIIIHWLINECSAIWWGNQCFLRVSKAKSSLMRQPMLFRFVWHPHEVWFYIIFSREFKCRFFLVPSRTRLRTNHRIF